MEQEKKILYVDDEEINLELFKLSFRNSFNVFTAKSAREGLEILKENHIPLIVTDYKMPEMNGIKFIEEIKRFAPEKVCIVISGFIESVQKENEDMVFSLIQKPWKKEEVKEIINSGFESYYSQNA